jgi:5S rRNA maturation endonuclease (ribonuclease M5)
VTPLERVHDALRNHGSRRSGPSGWTCPAHDDRQASLSVTATPDGKVVLNCHADCHSDAVVKALGLTWADLFPQPEVGARPQRTVVATYPYVDERSRPLFEVVRFAPKDFRQRRSDGHGRWIWNLNGTRRVLYRLPRVLDAVALRKTIYVVEGEKDVHSLEEAGQVATCNPGGAGKWHDDYAHALAGARVVVVADRDDAGRRHARTVAASLTRAGCAVQIVEPASGKDAADHLAGHSLDGLVPVDLDAETSDSAGTADSAEGTAVRRLRLTPASEIKPRPVRWTWEARIPAGEVTLIPGREGIGKSLLEVWLAANLTRGTLPGLHHGTPKPVLYAASEDSWERTIVPRLIAAGADLDMVYRVEVEEDDGLVVPLTLPVDCARLEWDIGRLGAAMLALDPLMSTIAAGIDTHKDRELRLALEPLGQVADRTGCSVVGLAHFNKSSSTDVLNLVTGSRAFTAVLRAVIAVARDPDAEDDSCVVSQEKNNLGRLSLPNLRYVIDEAVVPTDEGPAKVGRLRFTGESERGVRDILGDRGDTEERAERDEVAEFIRTYLTDRGGEASAGDVLKAGKEAGIPDGTLKNARRRAGAHTQKSDFSGGWVWSLNGEGPAKVTKVLGDGDVGPSGPSPLPSAEAGSPLPPEGDFKAPKAPARESVTPSAPSLSPSPPTVEPTSDGRLLDLDGDAPPSGQHIYVCDHCGAKRTTPTHVDLAGLPHRDCPTLGNARFQPAEEAG